MRTHQKVCEPDQIAVVSDEEIVRRVRAGETKLYGILMQRHRRKLHSVVRGILQHDAETEDVLQEAHVHALIHLDQFAGRSSFFTWLTRIAIYEALTLLRRRRRFHPLDEVAAHGSARRMGLVADIRNPEQQVLDAELRGTLQSALRMLPEDYRVVFTVREVDELSTAATAARLGITEGCVKTRLHRAKALLRRRVRGRFGPATPEAVWRAGAAGD